MLFDVSAMNINLFSMLLNFFKLTIRNLLKNRFSTIVNLLGLAIGFATFILIALYVYDENQYDRFHEKSNRIYRVYHNTFNPERLMTNMPALLYDPLVEGLPEAEAIARVFSDHTKSVFEHNEKRLRLDRILFTDPSFFDIFSFEIESGSIDYFRENIQSILITPAVAEKFFENENPVGQTMRYSDAIDLVVAGILKEPPVLSHLQFEVIINLEARRPFHAHMFENWGNFSSHYYMLLRPDGNPEQVSEKILTLFNTARDVNLSEPNVGFWLQPLEKVYLGSGKIETLGFDVASGSPSTVTIFAISSILILLLACFNYVNLATAKAVSRAREVGIRKVLGANRKDLTWYFLNESFVLVFIAMVLGVGLAELSVPLFAQMTGKQVSLVMISSLNLFPGMLLLLVIVGLISGLYPAFVISRFEPVKVLKGSTAISGQQMRNMLGINLRMRQVLLVLQFAVSIGLVLGSLVILGQTKHALNNAGFKKEAIIVVRNNWSAEMTNVYNRFRNEMSQYPFVDAISTGLHVPGEHIGNQGYLRQPDQTREEAQLTVFASIDYNYFDVLGAQILEGRNFDAQMATDSSEAVILNQSAVRALRLEDPVGTMITGFWDTQNRTKRVIGVVEDIHFLSMHRPVQPTAFLFWFYYRDYSPASHQFMVKINNASLAEPVETIKRVWNDVVPNQPIDFYFLDERYENMYRTEIQTGNTARVFTILALLIACMGLLGTTVYIMEARRKEFGIRKVLGASAFRLTRMISFEFSVLVLASIFIAWPITWYFLSRWLDNFAYRIHLSHWFFIAAGVVCWLLAIITVNVLAYSQARRNPVESLKYE